MRIMQVLLSPRIGGAESLAYGLSEVWDSRSITNVIHFLDANTDSKRSRVARIIRTRQAVSDFRPDVILSHTALPNLYARLTSSKTVPKVIVLHSSASDYSSLRLRTAERLLAGQTHHVVGVGSRQVDEYRERFGSGVPMSVISNGVRSGLPIRPSASSIPRSVLTLARVADVKNPRLWAEVARRLGENEGALNLTWWGPAGSETMNNFVDEHEERQRAGRFMGTTEDPSTQLQDTDILFHPSDRESLGLSVIEAACVGIPVVCSDEVASVLPAELAVSTFDTGNASSASATLTEVVRDFQNRAEIAIGQASWVRNLYSIERCADLYTQICENLTKPMR